MGTSNGSSVRSFALTVPGAKKARLVQQRYDSYTPDTQAIPVTNGTMNIPVTEAMSWVEVEL